jgi:hypothetical protein
LRSFLVSRACRTYSQVFGQEIADGVVVVAGTIAVAAAALAPIVVNGYRHDPAYLTANQDLEYQRASAWVTGHVPRDSVILTDNTMWIDIIQQGYRPVDVIWFYKLDLDPAVQLEHRGGWRAVDYVVESGIIAATDQDLARVRSAIAPTAPWWRSSATFRSTASTPPSWPAPAGSDDDRIESARSGVCCSLKIELLCEAHHRPKIA